MHHFRLAIALLPLSSVACVESEKLVDLGDPWTGDSDFETDVDPASLPAHFLDAGVVALDNTPAGNEVTDAGATLGRALFYDPRLSANQTVSCASCHQQEAAFADPEVLSLGFDGGRTARHGMPLVNVRWYEPGSMFWDERADTLEEQVLMPIQDAVEMGLTLDELEERVAAVDAYAPLFDDAFGESTVREDLIADALAQFVRTLVSTASPYDDGLVAVGGDVQRDFPAFSRDENAGKDLFFGRAGCAACHTSVGAQRQAAVFYVDGAVNNGLDVVSDDPGLGAVSGRPGDDGAFKSPSLRNVAETGPYMHDGRFATLDEVVDHYRSGVQPHPNLDRRLDRNGAVSLTDSEAAQLVAFMETLSDQDFLTDARFSDPWLVE